MLIAMVDGTIEVTEEFLQQQTPVRRALYRAACRRRLGKHDAIVDFEKNLNPCITISQERKPNHNTAQTKRLSTPFLTSKWLVFPSILQTSILTI